MELMSQVSLWSKPEPWILEDALKLIRELQPEMRQFGYHLTLGGGVLNRGSSKKDLDLFFLPMNPVNGNGRQLKEYLDTKWGPGKPLGVADKYPDEPGFAYKLKYFLNGDRIDVFIYGEAAPPAAVPSLASGRTFSGTRRARLMENGRGGVVLPTPSRIDFNSPPGGGSGYEDLDNYTTEEAREIVRRAEDTLMVFNNLLDPTFTFDGYAWRVFRAAPGSSQMRSIVREGSIEDGPSGI